MSKITLDSASKMVKIGIYTINWRGQLLRMGVPKKYPKSLLRIRSILLMRPLVFQKYGLHKKLFVPINTAFGVPKKYGLKNRVTYHCN